MTERLDSQSPADKLELPTPRTDEQVALTHRKISLIGCGADGGMGEVDAVTAVFARKLERDLEICRDAHMANCLACDTLRDEIDELRERLRIQSAGGTLSEERIAELTSEAMDGLGCQSSRSGHLIEDSIFNAISRGIEEALATRSATGVLTLGEINAIILRESEGWAIQGQTMVANAVRALLPAMLIATTNATTDSRVNKC